MPSYEETMGMLGDAAGLAIQGCWRTLGYEVDARLVPTATRLLFEQPAPANRHRIAISPTIVYHSGSSRMYSFDGDAVLTCSNNLADLYDAPQGGTRIQWGRSVMRQCNLDRRLYLEATGVGVMNITLTLRASGNTPVHTAAHTISIDIRSLAAHISSLSSTAAPILVLRGSNIDFRATVDGFSPTQQWTIQGANHGLSYAGGNASRRSRNLSLRTSRASAGIGGHTIRLVGSSVHRDVAVTHNFTVVDPIIRGSGDVAPIQTILVGQTREYEIAPNPGGVDMSDATYRWKNDHRALTVRGKTNPRKRGTVTGREAHHSATLSVQTGFAGAQTTAQLQLAVKKLVTSPRVLPVVYSNNASGRLTAANLCDDDQHEFDWSATGQGNTSGNTDEQALTIRTTGAGVAEATLRYKPNGGRVIEAKGAIAFLRVGLQKLRTKDDNWTQYAAGNGPGNTPIEVLLGLNSDPTSWNVGRVQAEARCEPTRVAFDDVDHTGEVSWELPDRAHIRFANNQPNNHGEYESKALLVARPKNRNAGPPAAPGYTDETVTLEYAMDTLGGDDDTVSTTEDFTVRVHRYGCSGVKWRRRGGGVSASDKLTPCSHHTPNNQQWHNQANWVPGTDARLLGDGDITLPGGHQHGGRCHWCSDAANPETSASPRTIWHYVPPHAGTLTEARNLANAIRNYCRNDVVAAGYRRLLTPAMKAHVNENRGRMLAVLRDNAGGFYYALSGWWATTAGWARPWGNFDRTDTRRTFRGFAHRPVTYEKFDVPFNIGAFTGSFGKMGRCAAPVVLKAAKGLNLKDIKLHEVWVSTLANQNGGTFRHGDEIASCQHCRRLLGAFLCEKGPR